MKRTDGSILAFTMMTTGFVVVAHAVAYMAHEFSHTFSAWALGYMQNPLALDYGTITPANVVLLSSVDDNVKYDPIFSNGHGWAAAAIALAGPYVGNAFTYVCLCATVGRLRADNRATRTFIFWLMLMCVGNVWSYVPIRAITTHADIAIAARGLHVSVMTLLPFLLVPSVALMGHFFMRACPAEIPVIASFVATRVTLMVAVTCAWFFIFFGGVAISGHYGYTAQAFSIISTVVLMPLSVALLWPRCLRRNDVLITTPRL
ncbi:hypothetical protein J2D73_18750 [Acetobacter sacchari]|uniref:Uncharacterized protein n=1 Tax=Acetobacter sacchari TaxID=2661687 RepID=A0ABS3M0W0_9PROT|nr:hypothetical protein [Acetobacter sacchari]MBO1361826.1 hypothetical protein [Acetobacter sacchari]